MYAGKIVEYGPVDDVLDRPLHPYTQGLLRSIPGENLGGEKRAAPPPDSRLHALASVSAAGCAFAPRCAYARAECQTPPDMRTEGERSVRCLFPLVHDRAAGGRE